MVVLVGVVAVLVCFGLGVIIADYIYPGIKRWPR